MTKVAAIYARVSSDRQKENHTIASQLAALTAYAEAQGYKVPAEWRFQDEGYSGATLLRPGLEAVRDLAAAGQLQAVLVYSPDRLSRKYAYQVLLAEELSRCGVELVFLQAPSGTTPEDQLLAQFQGMIAEYERAQIAERSRRGKRHRARQGSINVLSGAPYGYRYVRKSDTSAAYYEVIEPEAAVVRRVYEMSTQQGLSINAIARLLNEEQISTRTRTTRWERTTVWGMLRNPAYRGRACYGKTELRAATTHHASIAETRGAGEPRQCQPRAASTRLDRDRGSGFDQRRYLRPGARSSLPCCRGCWSVSVVAMPSIAPPRAPRHASFITTGAWVRMPIAIF